MKKAASLRPIAVGADFKRSTTHADYLPAGLLALLGIGGLTFAGMMSGPDTSQYLVIASPGSSLADTINIVQAAGGGLIEKSRFSNIVIAGSNQVDFPHAVRRTGAWLVVVAPIRGGCSTALPQEQVL